MRKLEQCAICQFYAHDPHIVCALHPAGPGGSTCLDFRTNPDLDDKQTFENPYSLSHNQEQWEPEGASYYNGELIVQPRQRWTQEQQLELLDNHPMFTGKCPQCGGEFDRDYIARVHWDCPCGWMDDTV